MICFRFRCMASTEGHLPAQSVDRASHLHQLEPFDRPNCLVDHGLAALRRSSQRRPDRIPGTEYITHAGSSSFFFSSPPFLSSPSRSAPCSWSSPSLLPHPPPPPFFFPFFSFRSFSIQIASFFILPFILCFLPRLFQFCVSVDSLAISADYLFIYLFVSF